MQSHVELQKLIWVSIRLLLTGKLIHFHREHQIIRLHCHPHAFYEWGKSTGAKCVKKAGTNGVNVGKLSANLPCHRISLAIQNLEAVQLPV